MKQYSLQQQQDGNNDKPIDKTNKEYGEMSIYDSQVSFEMTSNEDDDLLRNNVSDKMELLDSNFKPGNYDVVCGRGKNCFNHVGNKHFRQMISSESYLSRYYNTKTKFEKSTIIHEIIEAIHDLCSHTKSGFVKYDFRTQRYYVVSPDQEREKVGQALRDALSAYKKSKNTKKKKDVYISRSYNAPSSSSSPFQQNNREITQKKRKAVSSAGYKNDDVTFFLNDISSSLLASSPKRPMFVPTTKTIGQEKQPDSVCNAAA